MANDPQALTLTPAKWDKDSALWLSQAIGADTLDDLQQQAENGGALYHIKNGADTVGAFLLRVDQTAKGPQGVIVAGAAKCQGVDMLATCIPAIESLFIGCRSIRYHTNRPAMARKMAALGYRAAEIVSIKEV